jgi:DNA-binding CsgD family transcriptional regulator
MRDRGGLAEREDDAPRVPVRRSSPKKRSKRRATPRAAAVPAPNDAPLRAEHDEGVVDVRENLRRAALAFDQARTTATSCEIQLATRRWRPLVASRWSLLDAFDSDGRRFVVAVESSPPTRAPRRELSERELDVMTQARLGHTDKEIAYELGLCVSTVRVLVHRATRKLGAATRREALARFDGLPHRPTETNPG